MALVNCPYNFITICYPISKILIKAGFSGWWVLVYLLPGFNIVAIWVFAFSKWPNLSEDKLS
jgi:hypothetical protein